MYHPRFYSAQSVEDYLMPAVTLILKVNPNTHERKLLICYESDGDCLPFEHEHDHQQWVEKLLGHPCQHIADAFEIKRIPQRRNAHTQSISPSSGEPNLLRKPTKA